MKYLLTCVFMSLLQANTMVLQAKPLHLQAVRIPIAQLIMQLSNAAGVRVIIAGDLSEIAYVQWPGVPADKALIEICRLPNLRCYWATEESLIVTSAGAPVEPAMAAYVEPLEYVSAVDVVKKLQLKDGLLAGGKLVADEQGRQLLMWLPKDRIGPLRRFIKALDKPLPQVQIEARILIASRDAGASLRRGLQVDLSSLGGVPNSHLTSSTQVLSQAAGLALGLVAPHIHLNLELAAMEAAGQVLTLAQPQVVVQHLAQGSIETGQEVPYVIAGEHGDQRQWKQAVLGLTVSPRVLTSEQIELDLSVVQDSVGELLENGELALNTHRLHTQVRMVSGQTIVLGGALYEQQLQSLMENPAWMGLPFTQRWWHSQQSQSQSFELLVFVTPRLITRI